MTLDWSSDICDSQQCPLKPCLIKYELDIQVLFLKTVFFICGFHEKVTCVLIVSEAMEKSSGLKSLKSD